MDRVSEDYRYTETETETDTETETEIETIPIRKTEREISEVRLGKKKALDRCSLTRAPNTLFFLGQRTPRNYFGCSNAV